MHKTPHRLSPVGQLAANLDDDAGSKSGMGVNLTNLSFAIIEIQLLDPLVDFPLTVGRLGRLVVAIQTAMDKRRVGRIKPVGRKNVVLSILNQKPGWNFGLFRNVVNEAHFIKVENSPVQMQGGLI